MTRGRLRLPGTGRSAIAPTCGHHRLSLAHERGRGLIRPIKRDVAAPRDRLRDPQSRMPIPLTMSQTATPYSATANAPMIEKASQTLTSETPRNP
jgi:hypothetical protein